MARDPILEKYGAAVAQGEKDRLDRLFGRVDAFDLQERRKSDLRKLVGYDRLRRVLSRTGRRDLSEWVAVAADLQDDGYPDWTYWLDRPERRFRIRPWRQQEDGPPWSFKTPCITVLDGETGRSMRGIPAGAFALLGHVDRLEDSDDCCARLFAIAVADARRV